MNKHSKIRYFSLLILALIFIVPFFPASAAPNLNYEPMETLPGFAKTANYAVFISNFYKFGIWTVGICALIMIVIGGYMYAASGGNNASMEKAKTFITDAIVGLILALAAYLILYIINPELVKIQMGSAATTPSPEITAPAPTPPPGLPPAGIGVCNAIKKNQKPGQCPDASSELNNLLDCMNKKFGETMEISSISDGNGGVNCYQDHPNWEQCNENKKTNCCHHSKNSCHYGKSNGGKSYAVDFSKNSTADLNTMENYAKTTCGSSYAKVESSPRHLHVSASGCNTN